MSAMEIMIAVVWIACGAWNAGTVYAYRQRGIREIADKTRLQDTIGSMLPLVAGPLGVLATWVVGTYGHGWLMPGTKP